MRCDCGPSSRTAWPILYAVSLRIIAGPTMNEIASAVSAARTTRSVMYVKTLKARIFASAESHCARSYSMAVSIGRERVGDTIHLHEARALHEDRRALAGLPRRSLGERLDVVEVHRAGTEGLHRMAALLAERHQRVDARLLREAPDLGMHRRALRPELAHVADHEDLASRLGREDPGRRLHRFGVRVVAVVDHDAARAPAAALLAPGNAAERREAVVHGAKRNLENVRRGARRHRVAHVVLSPHLHRD